MKKVICVMIIMSIFLSANVSAVDAKMMSTGATALGTGIGLCLVPSLFGSGNLENDIWLYVGGGVLGIGGLMLAIAGALKEDPYYAKLKIPLPDVVSITSDGKSTFIGARFSFK